MNRRRFCIAFLIGGLSVALFLGHAWVNSLWGTAADLQWPLDGARRVLAGQSPYSGPSSNPYGSTQAAPLFYPLPAMLLLIPLAWLPDMIAAAIFVGISTTLAAYLLTRDGYDRLWICASASWAFAVIWAQWTPLLLLIGLTTAAAPLAACKPNGGLALLIYRPSWRAAGLCIATGLLSLLVRPSWPVDLLSLPQGAQYRSAVMVWQSGGPLLLLAGVAWRDARARLLLALAIIPVNLWFYDQLALGLIPQTTRGRLTWAVISWAALLGYAILHAQFGIAPHYVVVAGLYVPALALYWIERRQVAQPYMEQQIA